MSLAIRNYWARTHWVVASALLAAVCGNGKVAAQTRYATSDNMSGFVHRIHLRDANGTRIEPGRENLQPYSPEKTCGRCHDYDTISHGWHFNAVAEDARRGRPGQPWIWNDERTGTHLPLSYRGWEGTYNPDNLGLTRWQVAAKLGGFLPGGGVGGEASLAETSSTEEDAEDRSAITGALQIDCMMCHHNQGSGYSPFVWTEQIEMQNFAYAPTAALGLGTVEGSMSRLRNFDPEAEDAASKLPKLTYQEDRFSSDGTVFIDLVRKPTNDACYYCHTNMPTDVADGQRWLHDEDVHLEAGLSCVDCHRNALDHQTVRGYPGEDHPAGSMVAALSCQGCHLGNQDASPLAQAGRLGAPRPEHRGLPPLHFEKLSCTACHAGPFPTDQMPRQLNSIAHRLGEHVRRTGDEFPGIVAGALLKVDDDRSIKVPAEEVAEETPDEQDEAEQDEAEQPPGQQAEQPEDGQYVPHRMMWPSYWGIVRDGEVQVLNPEQVYEIVRRPLRTRRDFTEELGDIGRGLPLSKRQELLGEDRARVDAEEWNAEEQAIIAKAEAELRETQVNERMAAALAALEEELEAEQAIYVSGGVGFVRDGQDKIKQANDEVLGSAAEAYAWPLGHNVRPARLSLGVTGCLECHSDGAKFFQAEFQPVGLLPDQVTTPVAQHELVDADMVRLTAWNQLFVGRSLFKIAGLAALGLTCLITVGAIAFNIGTYWRKK